MLRFQKLEIGQARRHRDCLRYAAHRGCSYSFPNLFMWGRQLGAYVGEQLVIFSHFDGHSMYQFPVGPGDPQTALEAIMDDARQREIPCRITGMTQPEKELLQSRYPGQFRFHCDRDGFDYVYAIDDLADLKGRKYQQKRNHTNRFYAAYPDYRVKPMEQGELTQCRALTDAWFARRLQEDPHGDLLMEEYALDRAYRYFSQLEMIGLTLWVGEKLVAMTMASFLDEQTLDVHFEKADLEYPEAYAVINREFARFVRASYPEIRYLNREDDTGSAGLRQAKLSYHPHHMVEKCWAQLIEEEYND